MEGIRDAAHLCIDMQNIFARGGVWETPWMERVLPVISDLCARYRERTVFTRFITPERPQDRRGQWPGRGAPLSRIALCRRLAYQFGRAWIRGRLDGPRRLAGCRARRASPRNEE